MSLFLDTLATVRKLQAAGFSEDQAEAVTTIVLETQDSSLTGLVTKVDLRALEGKIEAKIDKLESKIEAKIDKLDVKIEIVRAVGKSDLREVELRLEAKIEAAKSEMVRWLVMTQAALAGFIFAVLKFLH